MFNRLTTYLKEVRLEMKKVNWPAKKDTVKYTIVVIGISLGVAVILGAFDFIFTSILQIVV